MEKVGRIYQNDKDVKTHRKWCGNQERRFSTYVYFNFRRRNRMKQQIFKGKMQDDSDIKVNTQQLKNILTGFFICCMRVFGEKRKRYRVSFSAMGGP